MKRDETTVRTKRSTLNRNNNQVIDGTSNSSSQFDCSRISQVLDSNIIYNPKSNETNQLFTITSSFIAGTSFVDNNNDENKPMSGNRERVDELFQNERLMLPERKGPSNTCTLKYPSSKGSGTLKYKTIVNQQYYDETESSSLEDMDEDFVYYKDEYFDYGDGMKSELYIESLMVPVRYLKKQVNTFINDGAFVYRPSNADSPRISIDHPIHGCEITELNRLVERLPTPIPGLYDFKPDVVDEGVLPIVTEVTETSSTDDNTARTIILENTWVVSFENEPSKHSPLATQIENFECLDEVEGTKWNILPQNVRKRWPIDRNLTEEKNDSGEISTKEKINYILLEDTRQNNDEYGFHLQGNTHNNCVNLTDKENNIEHEVKRNLRSYCDIENDDFQGKVTSLTNDIRKSFEDAKVKKTKQTGATGYSISYPQRCITDSNMHEISFRDKLIARAKAKREMLEAAQEIEDSHKRNNKSQEKVQNRNPHKVFDMQTGLTRNVDETNFVWDEIHEQNDTEISISPQKIRQNAAFTEIYGSDYIFLNDTRKDETECNFQRDSTRVTNNVKVANRPQDTGESNQNNSFETTASKRASIQNENRKSTLVEEKSTQTNVSPYYNISNRAKVIARSERHEQTVDSSKIQNHASEESHCRRKMQEINRRDRERSHEKSLICLYYRPDTSEQSIKRPATEAEGFTTSNVALYGSRSKDINAQLEENIISHETGCDKLLYRNKNFRTSAEYFDISSSDSVTPPTPWWRIFSNCMKCCKCNLKFKK